MVAKLQWVGAGWLGGTHREDECGAALVRSGELFNRRRKGPFELTGWDQRGGQ